MTVTTTVKLDPYVKQFIEEEISKQFEEKFSKAKELWQKELLLNQAKDVWEKEWDKEWLEIWN
jgi:hypothetical protein